MSNGRAFVISFSLSLTIILVVLFLFVSVPTDSEVESIVDEVVVGDDSIDYDTEASSTLSETEKEFNAVAAGFEYPADGQVLFLVPGVSFVVEDNFSKSYDGFLGESLNNNGFDRFHEYHTISYFMGKSTALYDITVGQVSVIRGNQQEFQEKVFANIEDLFLKEHRHFSVYEQVDGPGLTAFHIVEHDSDVAVIQIETYWIELPKDSLDYRNNLKMHGTSTMDTFMEQIPTRDSAEQLLINVIDSLVYEPELFASVMADVNVYEEAFQEEDAIAGLSAIRERENLQRVMTFSMLQDERLHNNPYVRARIERGNDSCVSIRESLETKVEKVYELDYTCTQDEQSVALSTLFQPGLYYCKDTFGFDGFVVEQSPLAASCNSEQEIRKR